MTISWKYYTGGAPRPISNFQTESTVIFIVLFRLQKKSLDGGQDSPHGKVRICMDHLKRRGISSLRSNVMATNTLGTTPPFPPKGLPRLSISFGGENSARTLGSTSTANCHCGQGTAIPKFIGKAGRRSRGRIRLRFSSRKIVQTESCLRWTRAIVTILTRHV